MPNAQYLGGVLIRIKPSVRGIKNPDANPPKNCMVSNMGSVAESGVSNEITANETEAQIKTRRGPKAVPIHIAASVMNICATVCAVVIHAPSSIPAPTAPRISARPKVDRRPFNVDMKVPIKTAIIPSQGMVVGGDAGVGSAD